MLINLLDTTDDASLGESKQKQRADNHGMEDGEVAYDFDNDDLDDYGT